MLTIPLHDIAHCHSKKSTIIVIEHMKVERQKWWCPIVKLTFVWTWCQKNFHLRDAFSSLIWLLFLLESATSHEAGVLPLCVFDCSNYLSESGSYRWLTTWHDGYCGEVNQSDLFRLFSFKKCSQFFSFFRPPWVGLWGCGRSRDPWLAGTSWI